MSYTISLTDGTVFATVTDGTVNTSSSVTLVGKNYAGYGAFLDENFIQHLENFSSASSGGLPTNSKLAAPLTGQIWWDKTNNLLKVYAGTSWKTISAATAQASQPSNNVQGDLWFDTFNQQLKVWTSTQWLVVGPAYSSQQGQSGALPETITNSANTASYTVTSLYTNGQRVAIVFDGTSFAPEAGVAATFPTIYPGITLTTANSAILGGTANNASHLNSLTSSQFMRSDANTATTGRLQVNNNSGLYVGTSNVLNISQNSNDANVLAAVSGGNLVLQANVAGTIYNSARVLGGNGTFAIANAATVGTTLSVTGNIDGGNLRTAAQVSATGNITGGNITTAGAISAASVSATGNVTGGNLITGGAVSASGNVSATGNVIAGPGSFFVGDGGALSNLSAGVSVTKITNGTSYANIGATNGDLAVTIGGTANVAVFTTNGGTFTNVSTPAITHTGSNAVGDIGSAVNYFNRLYTANVLTSTISASGNVTGGNIVSSAAITTSGNVTGGNVISSAAVSAASITATGNVNGGNILATTLVQATTVSASGNVIGGNITTAGVVSSTGNVTGGNIITTAAISAATVSATGNITGNYILGNGSQLTGISTGSATKIINGSSEVNIATSGGNANVTIGGVANIVVVSTSGLTVSGSILNGGANGVGNIGSSSTYFNTVFAKATSSQYADVAERFEADEYLEPGTVVELGGIKEITRSRDALSDSIFGVISTRPAYLMNGAAGEDHTHPPVAMTGRVPVRVIGAVRKGDRLVSAGNGWARAAVAGEITAFNVLGRALEDKLDNDHGHVEAIVTIK